MNVYRCLFTAFVAGISLCASSQQIDIPRIEQMSAPATPPENRDWTQVARDYDQFIYDLDLQGQYLPLVYIGDNGTNYSNIPQYYLNTYVGSFSAGQQAEAINILPSLVGATLAGIDKSNDRGIDWVGMSRNFFNLRPDGISQRLLCLIGQRLVVRPDAQHLLLPTLYTLYAQRLPAMA